MWAIASALVVYNFFSSHVLFTRSERVGGRR